MKAGDIHIAVTAQVGAFEASMKRVEAISAQTGMTAGQKFAERFSADSEKIVGNLFKRFAGPMIFATVADSLARGFREGFSPEVVNDVLKSLPFAGSFVNLGNAIAERILDTSEADMVTRNLAILATEQEEADKKQKESETARAKKALEDQKAESERFEKSIFDLKNQYTVAHLNSRIALYQENQNEEAAIGAKAAMDLALLMRNSMRETQAARTKEEQELLDKIYNAERDAINRTAETRKKQIRERLENEKKAIEDREKREMEAIQKEARARAEEMSRQMDAIGEQMAEVEQTREEVGKAQTTEQTALGSFTVSSYTDAEKKKIDEESLKELKRLRQSMENVGASGGFR